MPMIFALNINAPISVIKLLQSQWNEPGNIIIRHKCNKYDGCDMYTLNGSLISYLHINIYNCKNNYSNDVCKLFNVTPIGNDEEWHNYIEKHLLNKHIIYK